MTLDCKLGGRHDQEQ
ncbi:hypothetical protein LINGRAHAP2_LOCUS11918 [Linum grandiflorum]